MRGLERELAEQLHFLHLNVADEVGRRARLVFGVEQVPTIIILNSAGSEVYRAEGKLPRSGQIRQRLAAAD